MITIAFLGVDGVGKSTQIALLEAHLKQHGHTVSCIPFSADKLRNIMHDTLCELMYTDSSLEHVATALEIRTKICLAMQDATNNEFVLFDRYKWCRLAIASVQNCKYMDVLRQLYSIFPTPSLVFYLYAKMDKLQCNLANKNEAESPEELLAFHHQYLQEITGVRVVYINANKNIMDVHKEIREALKGYY